jgi:hypothetical protein
LGAVGLRLGLIGAGCPTLLALLGSASTGSMEAHAQTSEPAIEKAQIEQLQKEVRQRDATISDLVRRIEKLERQVGTDRSAAASPVAGPPRSEAKSQAGGRPPAPTVAAPGPALAMPTRTVATPEEVAREPAPAGEKKSSASSTGATQQAADAAPPAAGQLEVSAEAAERALERTLVATGNLLVPKGYAEVQPAFSYTRREAPTQVFFDLNRNEFNWALNFRFGLPWESQFEISLPYNLAQQQATNITGTPPRQVSNSWGNSVGDVTIGLAKVFVHERGWIPELIGRVAYEIPTGPESRNNVPLNSHRDLLAVSLTAAKRQDPLVFVVTGGYTKAFQVGEINLGDQVNFQAGAFLASSPETSLRVVLQDNFVQSTRINDVTFRGSDTNEAILTFGASSILGRGILADLQVGDGLTNSAPKYFVILTGTYRFGVPGL